MKKFELFFAFLLLPVDIAAIILAFFASYFLRAELGLGGDLGQLSVGFFEYLKFGLYILPVWLFLFAIYGLYRIKSTTSLLSEIAKIVLASSTAMLLLVLLIFFTKTLFFSRLIVGFIWIASILFVIVGRAILKSIQNLFLSYGVGQRKILIIGKNETSDHIKGDIIRRIPAYKIIGIVDGGEGLFANDESSLDSLAKNHKLDEILVTDTDLSSKELYKIIGFCHSNKIVFKYAPDIISFMRFSPDFIGSTPLMSLQPTPLEGWGRITKRFFDVIFSFLLLLILSPFFLLISLIQKITSRGPVFYRHERVGRDGKSFWFYKFRSMYIDKCDFKGGVKWTRECDDKDRITAFGKVLRKTNIDELPQLWNILVGDMSFVGPRPELPKLVDKFEKEIPNYYLRHHIKVGLTGWAQVNGLKGDTPIGERVKYDLYYIEHWSLWLDLKIIIKTIILALDESLFGKIEYRSRSRMDR